MPAPHAVAKGQTVQATVLDRGRNNIGNVGNTHTAPGCQKSPETIGNAGREYGVTSITGTGTLVTVVHELNVADLGTSVQLAAAYQCRVNGAARNVTDTSISTTNVGLLIDGGALNAGDVLEVVFTNNPTTGLRFTGNNGGQVPNFRAFGVAS